ncbi:MAG: glycine betaine ABC transporter substrate-binding protein [Dehalococcoidales bacterium]|jgi:glycine betaine/proline transport system substrate-binding protein|nr:glycine betaine ABC transporter substrate-binding protein [Dehalococcoidales bacterium]
MQITNAKKKNWLLIPISFFIVASLLLAGCFWGGEETHTIKLVDTSYDTQWLSNAVHKIIIEEGYGYPVETLTVSVPVGQVSLSEGDVDVWYDLWWWYYLTWYDPAIASGEIENLGISMEPAPSFWVIPQWVHEEHNINTIQDMKDNWELFQDPEDPSKGLFINCPIGWQCQDVNSVKMEAYGLTEYFNIVEPSAGALEAALAGAQMKGNPVFGYYWAPTALMGMYDWYILEEPAHDAEVWDNILAAVDDDSLRPIDAACAYEAVSPGIGIWSGLRDIAPDVVDMLAKCNIGLEQVNKSAAWVQENEIDNWEKAAIWYMREYDSRWKAWVTDDAYTKIKKFVDAYDPVP